MNPRQGKEKAFILSSDVLVGSSYTRSKIFSPGQMKMTVQNLALILPKTLVGYRLLSLRRR